MKILFIADVVGGPGRRAVEERLPGLKEELGAGFCILNGENLADGVGITPKLADRMLAAGADVVTLGNHVWRRAEIRPYLDETDRVIRPANMSARAPGKGMTIIPAVDGTDVAVINLIGSLFINPVVGPFEVVDELVEEARRRTPVIVVDFHGEATSEKVAAARWLDGKVTAVIGTHTHVQTNDARVQPGGRDDRPARFGDRRGGGACDPEHADGDAGEVRDGLGRCPHRRCAGGVRCGWTRNELRAGPRSRRLTALDRALCLPAHAGDQFACVAALIAER
jgi:metallophosphoesterase (TIGR00282 family)